MRKIGIYAVCLVFLAIMLVQCGSAPKGKTPKEAVIMLFGAMERDDRAAVAHLIDIPSLMGKSEDDYALTTDSPRTFYNPEDLLDDLTGDGKTKTRWFSHQRVIGNTEVYGDSARVEVSFINKKAGVQYYSKFGLIKRNDVWKIYSFKAIDDQ